MPGKFRSIVVIPARCGSVRFPRKNVHPLCGKPLISYPVEAGLCAKNIDKVMVSTDCQEVADVAVECGAYVPFLRPESISGSDASVVDAMIHAVEWLGINENYTPDYVFLLQPTTPVISQVQFRSVFEILELHEPDSVITVAQLQTTSHPYNVRVRDDQGNTRFWKGEDHYRSKELCGETFFAAANMWVTSYHTLINEKRLEGKNNYSVVVDWQYAMDIDYLEDLQMVEAWLEYSKRKPDNYKK